MNILFPETYVISKATETHEGEQWRRLSKVSTKYA